MSNILCAQNNNEAKNYANLCGLKKIRKIYYGIYTDDLQAPLKDIVLTHWMEIIAHIVPGGILSYRTAVDLKPVAFKGLSIIFITSTYSKTITLPGLIVKVINGDNHHYTEQVLPNLARSNRARMLLENLTTIRRAEYEGIKTIGVERVENILAKELQLRHEDSLNQIRDEAKIIAEDLGYSAAYQKLNKIISALLLTHNEPNSLKSPFAKSVAKNEPFDSERMSLFERLALYLKKCNFITRPYEYSKISFKNIAFFESYFSNFIEGTEFLIDEAEDIVFQGIEIENRHADSHDVLSHFVLSNDYSEMTTTPKSSNELLEVLQKRHAYLMKERPDKSPGKFKTKPNKAGNTTFVLPNNVIGTLSKAFEIYSVLNEGLEKALFMHFLIAEVHPFVDGNGRLSRIMMNAELTAACQYKCLMPSVHRDNYLNGLRLASRNQDFQIYCKVIDQAQAYTAMINWSDYSSARDKLETDLANRSADEGLPIFNRVLRTLKLSDLFV
jgi:Fic family protein